MGNDSLGPCYFAVRRANRASPLAKYARRPALFAEIRADRTSLPANTRLCARLLLCDNLIHRQLYSHTQFCIAQKTDRSMSMHEVYI